MVTVSNKASARGNNRTPERRTGRPSSTEVGQLNEHLLDTAEGLFLAHGFEGTSIDVLAVKARASKRTIYHRYSGKDALFEAVIERAIGQLLEGVGEGPCGDSLEARMKLFAFELVDRALNPRFLALTRTVIAAATRFPDLARSFDRQARLRTNGLAGQVLLHEVKINALPMPASVEVWAEQFMAITALDYFVRGLLGADTEQLRAEARKRISGSVAIFLNGCKVSRSVE